MEMIKNAIQEQEGFDMQVSFKNKSGATKWLQLQVRAGAAAGVEDALAGCRTLAGAGCVRVRCSAEVS